MRHHRFESLIVIYVGSHASGVTLNDYMRPHASIPFWLHYLSEIIEASAVRSPKSRSAMCGSSHGRAASGPDFVHVKDRPARLALNAKLTIAARSMDRFAQVSARSRLDRYIYAAEVFYRASAHVITPPPTAPWHTPHPRLRVV